MVGVPLFWSTDVTNPSATETTRQLLRALFNLFQTIVLAVPPQYRKDMALDLYDDGTGQLQHIGETRPHYADPLGAGLTRMWESFEQGIEELNRLLAHLSSNAYEPQDDGLWDKIAAIEPRAMYTIEHPEADAFATLVLNTWFGWLAQRPERAGSRLTLSPNGDVEIAAYEHEWKLVISRSVTTDVAGSLARFAVNKDSDHDTYLADFRAQVTQHPLVAHAESEVINLLLTRDPLKAAAVSTAISALHGVAADLAERLSGLGTSKGQMLAWLMARALTPDEPDQPAE